MAGLKRKHGEEAPGHIYANSSRNKTSVEPRIDPTYGQRSAIPLDETTNDEDETDFAYDEEMDALAYLRSVRCVLPALGFDIQHCDHLLWQAIY